MISLLRHLYAVIGYLENIFRKNNYFLIFRKNNYFLIFILKKLVLNLSSSRK